MTKTKAGPIRADVLKSFVERVERLEEERKAIGSDVRDVYAEAKGVGYDVKTMKKIVQERRQDAADRDEQEALLDTYRHALGMPGATYRGVAEQLGVTKSKLHRLVPNESRGTSSEVPPVSTQTEREEPNAGLSSSTELGSPAVAAPLVSGLPLSPATAAAFKAPEPLITTETTDEQPAAAIADGEAAEVAIDAPAASGSPDAAPQVVEPTASQPAADDVRLRTPAPEGGVGAGTDFKEVAHDRGLAPEPEVARVVPPVTEPSLYQRITGAFRDPDDDDLAIPAHLRRGGGRKAQASQSEAKRTQ